VSFRNRALFLESKGGGKDLPKTPLGSWADRGTDRNRRASDDPQEAQRDRQTLWASPLHQSRCLFSYRCGPL